MKKRLLAIIGLLMGVVCTAQTNIADLPRDSVLTHAQYLKSVFRADDAVALLEAWADGRKEIDERIFAELADGQFQDGDYEASALAYLTLERIDPDNLIYKIRIMQSLQRAKHYNQAIATGRRVLQRDSIPAVCSYMGDAFRQLEQQDSASLYYKKALHFKPLNAVTVTKAADLLIASKDYDGALSITEPLIEKYPDHAIIAPLQAMAHYFKGDYRKAGEILQRQQDLGRESYATHYYLGHCYWHTKHFEEAEKELTEAWQADSSDVKLALALASVSFETRHDTQRWLNTAWQMMQPDPLVLAQIQQQYGRYHFSINQWDQAISHYKEAYRQNPLLISCLPYIAYSYEQKKEYAEAIRWYELYLKQAKQDSKAYEYAQESVKRLRAEQFMTQ